MNAAAVMAMPKVWAQSLVVGFANLVKKVFHYYLCGVVASAGSIATAIGYQEGWEPWRLAIAVTAIPLSFIAAIWIHESR